MFAYLRLSAFAAVLLFAGTLQATDWDSIDNALKNSARSDMPVFLAVKAQVAWGLLEDSGFEKLRTRAETDDDAMAFQTAAINVAHLAMGSDTGYAYNPELVALYGSSGTCSVFAPGATRPLWTLVGGTFKDDVFKQAKAAYDAWRKSVDEWEAALKENKELKKDADSLLAASEAWAAGFVAKPALDYLDDAVKLIKKADKADSRLETLSLRRAQMQLGCGMYAEADKAFAGFIKDYKDSEALADARLGQARAMTGEGDKEGALKQLRLLKADDKASKVHEEAEALIEQLEQKG